MSNIVIIIMIGIIALFAIKGSVRHLKGEGGCCGGNSDMEENKKLEEPEIGKMVLRITGMKPEQCERRIEHAINSLDGVAAKVNLHKEQVIVRYSRPVTLQEIKERVEQVGYGVNDYI